MLEKLTTGFFQIITFFFFLSINRICTVSISTACQHLGHGARLVLESHNCRIIFQCMAPGQTSLMPAASAIVRALTPPLLRSDSAGNQEWLWFPNHRYGQDSLLPLELLRNLPGGKALEYTFLEVWPNTL